MKKISIPIILFLLVPTVTLAKCKDIYLSKTEIIKIKESSLETFINYKNQKINLPALGTGNRCNKWGFTKSKILWIEFDQGMAGTKDMIKGTALIIYDLDSKNELQLKKQIPLKVSEPDQKGQMREVNNTYKIIKENPNFEILVTNQKTKKTKKYSIK